MSYTVPETPKKGNNLAQPLLFSALIVLVALASFGLGRLSVSGSDRGNLVIHMPGEATTTTP